MTGQGEDSRRARQAMLANLRQELLAPASAILGYGEILHEEAAGNGPSEILPDLERIMAAARDLFAMVDHMLDPALAKSLFENQDNETAQKKLRHDLRTPINAIKGYGEMLLETWRT